MIGFVAAGLSNKQIAAKMGISDATAKVHRANIMRKMQARSLVELLRMADLLGAGAGNLPHAGDGIRPRNSSSGNNSWWKQ